MPRTKERLPLHNQEEFERVFKPLSERLVNYCEIGLSERYRKLSAIFSEIVHWTGCESYDFVLAQTKLEEKYGDALLDTAGEILDNYLFEHGESAATNGETSSDIAFAAFYYIALTRARYSQKHELLELLKKYHAYFIDGYPLTYELIGRYCSQNRDYKRMLDCATAAVKAMKKMGKENIALEVTYASAASLIAEYCFLHREIYRGNQTFSYKPAESEGDIISLALKPVGTYTYDNSDLADGKIETALEKTERVIKFNPQYPKYPFLKAQLLFFNALYTNNRVTPDECDVIRGYIAEAKRLVRPDNKNYDSILWQYERMDNIVEKCPKNSDRWYETEGYLFEAAKNNIIRATDIKQVQPKFYSAGSKVPHVFVSYSSRDFKAVYCDIIEYQRNGILCDYDNDMNSYDVSTDDNSKQKWYSAVEYKIREADCVLCYLSEHYASSAAILLELKLIEKYKKPVIAIDLRGDHIISRLFVRMANDSRLAGSITSDAMYWFAKKFEDDNNVIVRAKDPMLSNHIPQVKDRLYYLCPETVNMMIGEMAVRAGINTARPMEDYCLKDKDNKVYVIADGVTRQNKAEYALDVNKSESVPYAVSKLFCERFKYLISNDLFITNPGDNIEEKMSRAFRVVNAEVGALSEKYMRDNGLNGTVCEKPACVAIAAVVRNDMLFFGSIGDCMGILVRNNKKIVFCDKQTSFAFNLAGKEREREELIRYYINNSRNPFGYGVINGEPCAQEFFKVSHMRLEYGDSVYLVSDGVSDYIQHCNPEEYNSLTLEQILDNAVAMNKELKGENCVCDDMAIARIRWTCDRKEIERLAS